ncbi:MAG: pyruvate kinase [Ruminococcus sp.]|nr:pyruvate kinase [Ruminococcus sp.]
MRKTKIVCTLGPACDNEETLTRMINAGMNVARINMSHGTHEEQKERIDRLKKIIEKTGKNVAILLDTKGPEVRIGVFENGSVILDDGAMFNLYKKETVGTSEGISISYPKLVDIFLNENGKAVGRKILLDDGKIEIMVKDVSSEAIHCIVIKGGRLSNRKSINIPNYHISMPYVSAKDRADIEFGLNQGAEIVAASFIRSADDVTTLRDYIDSIGFEGVDIVSKIENQSGYDDIDRIIEVSNGIMVARGDMGVEIPFIKLPEIQKTIIRKTVAKGKYVITATQMLESMTTNPLPTRAEISDVANAVYDGTSAVMLSGESAAGKYPVESVMALSDICTEAESNHEDDLLQKYIEEYDDDNSFRKSICHAAREVAMNVGAKAIIVESATGKVARAMAHFRPECPIIAVVTSTLVQHKLCLSSGVTAVLGDELSDTDAITKQAMNKAKETGIVTTGDTVVVISSNKLEPSYGTDTLQIKVL